MIEKEQIPVERRLADPLVRKDGILLDLYINDEEGFIRVSVGSENVLYALEEVVLLGHGNFEVGTMRIRNAYFRKIISPKRTDEERIYEEEIEKAKLLGKLPLSSDRVH